MAYLPNIPQATDQMSQSQSQLLGNFTEVNTFVNVDHGAFNGATEGMHVKVTLPQGPNPPSNAFYAGSTGIYCAFGITGTTIPQTYAHNTIAGGVNVNVPYTESILAQNASPSSIGWTYLPSGILMKWGAATLAVVGANAITINAGPVTLGPNFTQIYNAQLTCGANGSTAIVSVSGLTVSTITATTTVGNISVFWFAIGRGV